MKTLHGADAAVNVEELRYLLQSIVEVTAWHGDYGDAICPGGHTDARLYLKGKPYLYCHHERCQAEVLAVNAEIREAFVNFCAGRNIKIELTPEEKKAQEFRRYLRSLRADARLKLAPEIIKDVPVAHWREESPFPLNDWPVKSTWAPFVGGLFAPNDLLWIGDLQQSGRDFKHCFRTAAQWIKEMDIPPGPQVCAAPFDTNKRELQDHIDFRVIPKDEDTGEHDLRGVRDFYRPKGAKHFVGVYIQNGQYRRIANFLRGRPYLVVESDTLTREQFGSLVRYLQNYTTLRSMTDTAGKGIHAIFDRPDLPSRRLLEIYAIIEGLGADPLTLNRKCPTTRLPGYTRADENFNVMGIQKLLYLSPKYPIL